MNQNITPHSYELSQSELSLLRKDANRGFLGALFVLIIGGIFSSLFYTAIPARTHGAPWFVFVPILCVAIVVIPVVWTSYQYLRDIKDGHKRLTEGRITYKFTRTTIRVRSSALRSQRYHIRHYIVVDDKRFLVTAGEFNTLEKGDKVSILHTRYSGRVMELNRAAH